MDIAQAMNRIATKIIISDNVAMLLLILILFQFYHTYTDRWLS